jgi:hypothetical protein
VGKRPGHPGARVGTCGCTVPAHVYVCDWLANAPAGRRGGAQADLAALTLRAAEVDDAAVVVVDRRWLSLRLAEARPWDGTLLVDVGPGRAAPEVGVWVGVSRCVAPVYESLTDLERRQVCDAAACAEATAWLQQALQAHQPAVPVRGVRRC